MASRPIAFGFPSVNPVPPSQMHRRLAVLRFLCAVMSGALLLSAFLGVILAGRLVASANAIPFVADGGVAGCQVPLVKHVGSV